MSLKELTEKNNQLLFEANFPSYINHLYKLGVLLENDFVQAAKNAANDANDMPQIQEPATRRAWLPIFSIDVYVMNMLDLFDLTRHFLVFDFKKLKGPVHDR